METTKNDFKDVLKNDERFRYQLLGRLKSDCDYYLNTGKNAKHFWAGSGKEQIELMFALHESFSEDEKPEWLTLEQIKEYEKKIID